MKIRHFILGLIMFPFYPLLKRVKNKADKVQIGEKVVVVTESQGKKKIIQ
jgi:uncharacterized OB-fold protein